MICFSTINDTSSKYKKSYTSGKSCSILTTLNNCNRLYFLDKITNVENHFSFMLCLLYTVPKRNFFRHLTYSTFLQNCEYIKMHFFPCVVNEWKELNHDIRSCRSEGVFFNASLTKCHSLARAKILKYYNEIKIPLFFVASYRNKTYYCIAITVMKIEEPLHLFFIFKVNHFAFDIYVYST